MSHLYLFVVAKEWWNGATALAHQELKCFSFTTDLI
jgi:hypothetical protein